tara:strand:- start:164 stop:733 length:570 start_codon:yes stop_codon:yes gene_type:complete
MPENVTTLPAIVDNVIPNQDQNGSKITVIYPFEYVEGLLAQSLGSMYHAIDSLRPENQKRLTMGRMENIRASASIIYMEAKSLLDCLDPYHDASLNPKHRLIRVMLRCVAKGLEVSALASAKTTRHKAVIAYARLGKDLLETFHKLLHSSTPIEEREATLAKFLRDHLPLGLGAGEKWEGIPLESTPIS